MSATIDERVVEMRFDNRNFEKNVKTSMSTLDKLKKSLNLKGTSDGLEEISKATKKVDFNLMSKGVDAVKVKFSALEVVAMTTLSRIANSAITTGKNLVSAFTIDPVKTGLQEYETQINAVQTILANTKNKGSTLNDVNNALNELNKYADLTIYNFTEMTRNIGTFTAAGVGLKESTTAIQGIANLAAVSGSNAQQASTAMYQLSQALAAGSVKLQDWNSVVNAGMGGEIFQEALKKTARVHGIAVDDMIKKAGSFRESLQKGWITSEVLTETLAKMTKSGAAEYLSKLTGISQSQIEATQVLVDKNEDGNASYEQLAETLAKTGKIAKQDAIDILEMADTATDAATKVKTFTQLMDTLKEAAQSGWTQTWQLIIGDFEESKVLFTEASDYFGGLIEKASTARNQLLDGALNNTVNFRDWKALANAGADTENFRNLLIATAKSHNIAIDEMIASEGNFANTLKNGWLTDDIYKEAIEQLSESEKQLIEQEAAGIANEKERTKYINKLTKAVKDADESYAKLLEKMNQPSGRELLIDAVRNSIKAIIKPIETMNEAWRDVFPPMTSEQLKNIIIAIHEFSEKLILSDKNAKILKDVLNGVFKVFKSITTVVNGGLKESFKVISSLLKSFNLDIGRTASSIGNTLSSIADWISENVSLANGVKVIGTSLQNGINVIKKWSSSIKNAISNTDILQGTFHGISSVINAVFKGFKQLGSYIAKVAGPMLSTIGDGFANMFQSDVMENGLNLLNSGVFTVGIMSMKKVFDSLSDTLDDIGNGRMLENIKGILDSVRGSFEDWQKNVQAKRLLTIASAIGILAISLITISGIDGAALSRSLFGIGIMFAEMVGVLTILNKNMGNYKAVKKASSAMVTMSAAILIMTFAIKNLSTLSTDDLTKGIVGIGALAGMMTTVSIILSKNVKRFTKGATGMILFSVAIKILSSVCKDMSKLSLDDMIKGLVGVGILLAEVLIFTNLNKNSKGVLKTSVAMIALGTAMKILASAVKDFSTMNWSEIGRGLSAMGGALVELIIAMNLMPKGMLSKSTGLAIVATSLLILSSALSKFGSMSWEEIGRGLTAFGISLLEITVALYAMSGTLAGSAALLVAAGAISVLTPALLVLGSMSLESIGKGLLTLAGVFTILGVAGLLLTPVIPTILSLSAAIGLLGVGILGVGAGVTLLATGLIMLSAGGVAMTTSVMTSLSIIISGLLGFIPLVAKQIGNAIITFVKVIGEGSSEIATAVVKIVNAILDIIEGCIPRIVDVVLMLITELLNSILNYLPEITTTAISIVIAFIDAVASKLPDVIESGINLIISFLNGIGDGLSNHSAELGDAVRKVIYGIIDVTLEVITGAISGILDAGKKWIIDGLIPGITSMISNAKEAFTNLVTNIKDVAGEKVSDFFESGKNLVYGFINGIKSKITDAANAAKSIGSEALNSIKKVLGIHSPSKEMAKVGSYAIDGFIKGLTTSRVKIDTVTNAVFTKFVATATNVTNVTKNAKGIITSYAKNYVKNTKNVTKSTKKATKAIQAYSTMIYKQSSYYKEDKKNLEGHLKDLKKYYSERDKLNAKLAKAKNKNDKKNIQNSIKENKKNIETMKKQIDKDQKQMVTNAKKALNEVKKEIKNAVKDYVSIFNASVGSINLFGDVELTGKKAIKSNIKDSLLELTALSNFSLDSGINFLEKFSSSVENLADTVQSATDEVTESKEELTNAENELREAQAKSLAVNGRSQKYLDQIAEAETKVAEAKQKVVEAEEKLASITKGSSQEMLENMKSNVEAFDAWQSDLEKLSKMDISKDLLAHLKGLGISGAEQVSAFVKMTKEELVKANEYWEKYSSMSSKTLIDSIKDKSQAMTEWAENIEKFSKLNIDNTVKVNLIQEFETQGIDSAEYIKQLLSMSESELNDFVSSYKQMMEIPEKVAANVAKSIDEVNKKTDNSKTIINNYLDLMRENLNAEKEYESNLKKLKKNGISDGLYEQLVESGDKSLIASFAKASKSDIEEANKIYAEAAKESANQWLESYGDSISDAEKWNKNMKKLTKLNIPKKMKESLYEEFKEKGIEGNNILEIILGFDKKQLQDFISKYKKSGNVVNSVTNDIMAGSATVSVETQELINKSAKDSADKAMNAYNKAIKDNEAKIKKTSKDVGKTVVKSIDKHANKKTSEPLGKNVCIGLANGIKNNKSIAINEAVVMAKETISKSKKTLKINSPSKVFMEFGKYCDEGLAIGLTKYASLASDASESIGDDAISNMQNSIDKISAWANSGIESEPTIRPVLDMSELQRQAGSIGGMFNAQAISVNADMAAGISNRMYNASGSQNGSTTNNSYDQSTQTINNTFNITGDNPKEIANEVSKILQHQVNRRSVTWA